QPSPSLSRRRVEDRRPRPRAVAERREVDVEAGARADGAEERAVDPVHHRAVQLAGPPEPLAVLVHVGDEDVLDLEIAARMEQRHGVYEALRSAAREVEANVV